MSRPDQYKSDFEWYQADPIGFMFEDIKKQGFMKIKAPKAQSSAIPTVCPDCMKRQIETCSHKVCFECAMMHGKKSCKHIETVKVNKLSAKI